MKTQHDEETARMLAELEGEQTEREKLEARATELGVKFRGNTGDDTLRERIAEAEAAPVPEVEAASEAAPVPEVEAASESEELEAALAAVAGGGLVVGSVITNPGKYVRRIGNLVIAPSGQKALTERELSDERTMAKVNHMIALGVLHRGAD